MSLLAEFVKEAALAEGFSLAGIAPASPLGELDSFPAWIEAGYHGEMEYLAKTDEAGAMRRTPRNATPPRGDGSRATPSLNPTITKCCWDGCGASSSAWWNASLRMAT